MAPSVGLMCSPLLVEFSQWKAAAGDGSEKATQVSHLFSSTVFTAPIRQSNPITAPPCASSNLEVGIRLFSHITNNLKISVAIGANICFSVPWFCRLVLVLLGSADLSPGCQLGQICFTSLLFLRPSDSWSIFFSWQTIQAQEGEPNQASTFLASVT